MSQNDKPLIVIVGPTASGKTSLAIDIAEEFGGEIICADSRTIYKGMDIGTAKPDERDVSRVVHWGLDLATPGDYFTVADFKIYADEKIKEIRERNKIPFLVGGTGLYVDAVLFDYKFGAILDIGRRKSLEDKTIEQLHLYCEENNIELPENKYNKRYVIRTIERNGTKLLSRDKPIDNAIVVGISTDKSELRRRIETRAEQIFNSSVVEEARILGCKYGWDNEAMTGNIYPLIKKFLDKEIDLVEMKRQFVTLDWRLAKRQITWLKRNKFIIWGSLKETKDFLSNFLVNR